MQQTPKALVDGVGLTAAAVNYYDPDPGVKTVIKKATFTNNYTVPVTVTIYIIPSGGSATYENC